MNAFADSFAIFVDIAIGLTNLPS